MLVWEAIQPVTAVSTARVLAHFCKGSTPYVTSCVIASRVETNPIAIYEFIIFCSATYAPSTHMHIGINAVTWLYALKTAIPLTAKTFSEFRVLTRFKL